MEHGAQGVPIVIGKNQNGGRIIRETARLTSQPACLAFDDKPQPSDVLTTKDGSIGRSAILGAEHVRFRFDQRVLLMAFGGL
jgi:hypothetical protein